MTDVFLLDDDNLPWGDYGHVLVAGMSRHTGKDNKGALLLDRTGPFVPPISFPSSDIVVTDSFKKKLQKGPFKGIKFRRVRLLVAVKINWEKWDRTSPEPKFFPRGGEPENYIDARRHDPEVEKAIGKLWEIIVPEDENYTIESKYRRMKFHYKLVKGTRPKFHLFRPKGMHYLIVSDTGKQWLEKTVPEWVSFEALK